jgi:DNA primase
MPKYTPDSRDRVRAAVDMLAVVGSKVELQRRGVDSYFGLCPFHDERSSSFHVRPDEQHYYCFGCSATGDAFDFVMETEGLDFPGALESLADRFGVTLQTVDENPGAVRERQEQDRQYELLGRTAAYYTRYLWESPEAGSAREYLLGRGLEEQTLRDFRVGYAPNAWDRILLGSQRAGYSVDDLVAVGLVRRSDRSRAGAFDFFREQIMFPTADGRGRVQGFGARRMREDQSVPKYVNTAENKIYRKRRVLYGIDRARGPAAKLGRMILVEGYTDVLALHQAGITNAVGIMGTSFTEDQLAELQRSVTVLELCLDADAAGQGAMIRAAGLADGRGLELRVVELPEGSDPADLVLSAGPDRLRELVAASVPFVQFNVERILASVDPHSAESRQAALTEIAPVFGLLHRGLLRDEIVRRVSGILELTEGQLLDVMAAPPAPAAERGRGELGTRPAGSVDRDPGRYDDEPRGEPVSIAGPAAPGSRTERLFLALCIAVPDAGAAALSAPEADLLLATDALRRVARHLRDRTRSPLTDLPADDETFARQVASLVELSARVPDPGPDRLEHARLLLDLDRLERAIRRARAQGEGTSELARERELVRDAYQGVVSRLEQTV